MPEEICHQRKCELVDYRDRPCEPATCSVKSGDSGDCRPNGDPWSALYRQEEMRDE